MPDPQVMFRENIRDADTLTGIFDYLTATVVAPMSCDDLLRSKVVYAVSAFDKLIHDLVRDGMVEIFKGKRPTTPKYLAEPIPLSVAQQLAFASTPPPEVVFEQAMQVKLKALSFQDPDKIAAGLSYIWSEEQKWQRIAAVLGMPEKTVKVTLRLIAGRRNSIVHEADTDPSTHTKFPISRADCDHITGFITSTGNAICSLVK